MPAVLDENTQYVDIAGKPLVNGKVYFGVQGADPTASPITIYSDRALTVVITNPQDLDDDGRTVNKVWVPGRYSVQADDLNGAQKYINLDNGESADKGITVLENISGGNTIIATAASTITAYEDLEQYTFRTSQVNTTAITLNIDTVGAKSIVKNHDLAILPGEFVADANIIVSYNATDDVFEWVNQNAKRVSFYEAINIASAATTDVWSNIGNTIKITGNAAITSFGTAPNEGAIQWVTFSGTPTLTHSANLNLQGGVNYTAAADDFMRVYADSTTQFDVQIFKADGKAVVVDDQALTEGTPLVLNPFAINSLTTQAHGLSATPTFLVVELECLTAEHGYSIGDIVDFGLSGNALSATSFLYTISKDATNVVLSYPSTSNPNITNKATKAITSITPANWKLTIRSFV